MADRAAPETRDRYRHFLPIPTRWMDNDVYGHVNNVVYYSYVDTIVNRYLIDAGLDIRNGQAIGIVVESRCRYHAPVAFPETLEGALRVGHLGTTSVRYEVALFRAGEEMAAAAAHFVHVFVDRDTRRPVPIPPELRAALERLVVN